MRQRRSARAQQGRPRGAWITVFHVRELTRVKELLADLHASARRKRSAAGSRGSRGIGRARSGEHPPLYMPDEKHLIIAAPTRAWANRARRATEGFLEDAIEHVQTDFIKVPVPAAGAGPGRRGRR